MTKKEREDAEWGRRFAALMDRAGVTCPELQRELKTSRATPYAWRSGTRIPSRGMQPRIAKLLGVSIAELNGWAA